MTITKIQIELPLDGVLSASIGGAHTGRMNTCGLDKLHSAESQARMLVQLNRVGGEN